MSDLKQARALLEAAKRDYSALRGMGNADVFADEIFGFHAEQAVEKLLKALLALLGQPYPATHDLARLVDMLKEHGEEAARFDELVEYTPYAVQFRYGANDPSAMPLDRDTAIQRVKVLLEDVQRRVEDMKRS